MYFDQNCISTNLGQNKNSVLLFKHVLITLGPAKLLKRTLVLHDPELGGVQGFRKIAVRSKKHYFGPKIVVFAQDLHVDILLSDLNRLIC